MKTLKFIVVLAISGYAFYYVKTATEWHFIDNANLIFHEAGHVIFSFFGEFIHILGGSLFQVLLPIVFVLYFYLKRQPFSASLLLFWVSFNLISVSIYAGDSLALELPLLGGDGSIHDWNYMLAELGILHKTELVAKIIYLAGVGTAIFAGLLSFFYAGLPAGRQALIKDRKSGCGFRGRERNSG